MASLKAVLICSINPPALGLWSVEASQVIVICSVLLSCAAEGATGVSEAVRASSQAGDLCIYAQESA